MSTLEKIDRHDVAGLMAAARSPSRAVLVPKIHAQLVAQHEPHNSQRHNPGWPAH